MRPVRDTRYARAHDLDNWKTDERVAARGFAHRWDSVVADGNGEDFFLQVLDQHMNCSLDVLDVGCGHGDLTLSVARRVRSAVGVDRNRGYVDLADELLGESGLANVRFIQAELAGQLPLPDRSVDLVVDRRGPPLARFLDDLQRVARPGACIVGMHPAGTAPAPPWAQSMPSMRERFEFLGYDEVASWVTGPLAREGLTDYRLWWIDVPEYLYSARSLYDRLAADDSPPWDAVSAEVEAAYAGNDNEGAVSLRHIRLVWMVRLP
jgi:SAM-dependent methyltransferase